MCCNVDFSAFGADGRLLGPLAFFRPKWLLRLPFWGWGAVAGDSPGIAVIAAQIITCTLWLWTPESASALLT
jgi:hypothetical protein